MNFRARSYVSFFIFSHKNFLFKKKQKNGAFVIVYFSVNLLLVWQFFFVEGVFGFSIFFLFWIFFLFSFIIFLFWFFLEKNHLNKKTKKNIVLSYIIGFRYNFEGFCLVFRVNQKNPLKVKKLKNKLKTFFPIWGNWTRKIIMNLRG